MNSKKENTVIADAATINTKLDKVYNRFEKKMKSQGMTFRIENEDGSFVWERESGVSVNDEPFMAASVTKLFASAVIFKLVDKKLFSMETKIADILPSDMIENLHIYKGSDYSRELTVRHLISNTSGLPDYLLEHVKGEKSLVEQIEDNPFVTFDDALNLVKRLTPHFAPGSKGRAYYADMNFDLLGKIMEVVTGLSCEDCYKKYIYTPLGLTNTYVYTTDTPFEFPGFWFKNKVQNITRLLCNWPASGSIVSTKTELIVFLKAFWNGALFDKGRIPSMKKYNFIQFMPMQYGVGHMKFADVFYPPLIGHSGSTGSLCYYIPKYGIYIAGTINEMNETKAIRLGLQLTGACKILKQVIR